MSFPQSINLLPSSEEPPAHIHPFYGSRQGGYLEKYTHIILQSMSYATKRIWLPIITDIGVQDFHFSRKLNLTTAAGQSISLIICQKDMR